MSDNTAQVSSEATKKPTAPKISGSIHVSSRQKGNPLLKSIRKVPWEFVDGLVPDYTLGTSCVAMYLSVRYHTLQPNYIHERLKALGQGHRLRVLLVQVDVKEPHHVLSQLMRVAILSELTLMLAWSHEEAAGILETYKSFENKPPDMIMEKSGTEPHEKLIEALTSVKSVNKTDAVTLLGTFKTLREIVKATPEDLALCPGFGPNKAKKLHKVLNEAFRRNTEVSKKVINSNEKDKEKEIDIDDFDDEFG
eukprot:TRINITY_DN14268_c0_g1_i1.p1 TRINITY_DN14268_c0_g1~~TRINITY_DN14268_c0_g1_i1.p1  ORF type:complete len:251 (-),score=76.35 TRINITY_DN14268_c0_g1_i1:59-811(-)